MADIVASETEPITGQRGPAEHERRQQILQAAEEYFRHYGYRKTTVSDIAKAIDLSSAYIYKFFDSKQAIGEAVCSRCLTNILREIEASVAKAHSPSEGIRRIFSSLASQGIHLINEERKIYDIVAVSYGENWGSLQRFHEGLYQLVRKLVARGRESGEFERKTPLEETCRAICRTTQLFFNPTLLEATPDRQEEEATAVANMVIRSLVV